MMLKKNVIISIIVSSYLYGASNEEFMKGLGDLEGPFFFSMIQSKSLNADGTIIVGGASSSTGTKAFKWTDAGGMEDLGNLAGGASSRASGISANGNVIVGSGSSTNGTEAFRWTQDTGMVGLGDLADGTFSSSANGTNDDGSVIVGVGHSANGFEAFRWTQATGMVGLGDLGGLAKGNFNSSAMGVNSDGSVIIGEGTSKDGTEAFRWTQATGMVGLGDLAGGTFQSTALDLSGDGSIVVGYSSSKNGTEAFRWTQNTGMVGLGDLVKENFNSRAYGITRDGSVIVGSGMTASGAEAFRWTKDKGMQSLTEWLAEDGYTLTGWNNTTATSVSDDGNIIAGYGTSANGMEAFIAKNKQGMIGLIDYYTSIESINGVAEKTLSTVSTMLHGAHAHPINKRNMLADTTLSNVSTMLHGAHGHPISKREIDKKRIMWIAGDISSDNRNNTKDTNYIGEVGVSIKHNDDFIYSISAGKMQGNSKLDYKGEMDTNGEYLALEADLKLLKDQDLYSTTMISYGQNDLTIKRGYDNAGVLTHSNGDTKQQYLAFKQRFQYQITDNFYPYIELNHIQVDTDGYSESGGGFPATYNKSKEDITDWRIGVDANFDLNESNILITTLEAVHRVQDKGNGVSGQITGLRSFNVQGRTYDQNWMRATVGLEHIFEDNSRFTFTLNSTTKGEDPAFWSGFNYSMPF